LISQQQNNISSISFPHNKTEFNADLLNEVNKLLFFLKIFFWCAPFGYLYFHSYQLLYEPGLGAGIDPGMALTPFPSSIGIEPTKEDTHTHTHTHQTAKQSPVALQTSLNRKKMMVALIILHQEDINDNNMTPEAITVHVNCYVTRDIIAKEDLSKYTQVTTIVTQGDTTSYLHGTFYTNLTTQARPGL